MEVTFRKSTGRKDYAPWIARRGKAQILGSGLGSDPRQLPHDVVTFLIERELGLIDGFFGTVAAGGTFRSMRKRRTTHGKSVIAANRPGLDRAERIVNQLWSQWRAGVSAPCSELLSQTEEEWMALPPGGELTLRWDMSARRPDRARHTAPVRARRR